MLIHQEILLNINHNITKLGIFFEYLYEFIKGK